MRTAIRDDIRTALVRVLDSQEALHCTRVWEAWSYGTMTEDDFAAVTQDEASIDELVEAVAAAIGAGAEGGKS